MRHLVFILIILLSLNHLLHGQTTLKPSSSITPCLGQTTKAWFTTSYAYDSLQWVNNVGKVVSKEDTLYITPDLTPTTTLYYFDLKLYVTGTSYTSRLFVVPFKGFEFSINENTEICSNDTLLLQINNPNNENLKYKWFSNVPSFVPPTSTTLQVEVSKEGKYWVRATNQTETCSLVDTMSLNVFNQPVELGDDKALCEGQAITLKNLNPESTNTSHLWEYNGKSNTSPTLSPTESGVYTLTTTISPVNCSFKDSVRVIFSPLPKVDLTASAFICKGETFIIKNTLQNPSTVSYSTLWESDTDLPSITPGQETISVSKAGKYKLTLNTGSCSVSDSTSLRTLNMEADLGKNISDTCTNSGVTLYNLKANTEPTTTFYLWKTPQGNFLKKSIVAKEAGYYYLTINSDIPQCSVKDSVYIGVSAAPTFDLGDNIVAENSFAVYDGTFSNRFKETDYTFIWKNVLKDSIYSTKANLILEKEGEHPLTLIITNKVSKCVSSDNITIIIPEEPIVASHVIFIPSAFSPSSMDSDNSRMKILGPDIAKEDFKLEIFNRWGQIIYETSDYELMSTEGWDGTGKNTAAQNTTYTYTAVGKFIDGKSFKETGTITLLR